LAADLIEKSGTGGFDQRVERPFHCFKILDDPLTPFNQSGPIFSQEIDSLRIQMFNQDTVVVNLTEDFLELLCQSDRFLEATFMERVTYF
jgi:hypothetical protein